MISSYLSEWLSENVPKCSLRLLSVACSQLLSVLKRNCKKVWWKSFLLLCTKGLEETPILKSAPSVDIFKKQLKTNFHDLVFNYFYLKHGLMHLIFKITENSEVNNRHGFQTSLIWWTQKYEHPKQHVTAAIHLCAVNLHITAPMFRKSIQSGKWQTNLQTYLKLCVPWPFLPVISVRSVCSEQSEKRTTYLLH